MAEGAGSYCHTFDLLETSFSLTAKLFILDLFSFCSSDNVLDPICSYLAITYDNADCSSLGIKTFALLYDDVYCC